MLNHLNHYYISLVSPALSLALFPALLTYVDARDGPNGLMHCSLNYYQSMVQCGTVWLNHSEIMKSEFYTQARAYIHVCKIH